MKKNVKTFPSVSHSKNQRDITSGDNNFTSNDDSLTIWVKSSCWHVFFTTELCF